MLVVRCCRTIWVAFLGTFVYSSILESSLLTGVGYQCDHISIESDLLWYSRPMCVQNGVV